MSDDLDPFVHHPVLRDKITDPFTSFFRTFRPADLDARLKARGAPDDWRFSDAEIETARQTCLAGRRDRDLWVFAYGSLMWDPAFRFAEVRRATLHGYARRFCLKDTLGGRGTRKVPGLMVGLDEGPACEGLAFRISKAHLDEETAILWRREQVVPAYRPVFAEVSTGGGTVEALAFVADHAAPMICPDLTRAEQVRYIATGKGFLGTSLEYLENLAAHFSALGIEDQEISGLLADARAFAAELRERR